MDPKRTKRCGGSPAKKSAKSTTKKYQTKNMPQKKAAIVRRALHSVRNIWIFLLLLFTPKYSVNIAIIKLKGPHAVFTEPGSKVRKENSRLQGW